MAHTPRHAPGSTRLSLVLTVIAATACGGGAGDEEAETIHVSLPAYAGTTMECRLEGLNRWALDTAPILRITEDPDGEPLFRVTAVRLLDDGRLANVEKRGSVVHLYGRDGTHLLSFGREGEGPGEFRFANGLDAYRGDSLAVYDAGLKRVSLFSEEGEFGRSVRVGIRQPNARFVGALADGSFLLRDMLLYFEAGGSRDSSRAVRYAPEGAVADTLWTLPHSRSFSLEVEDGLRRGQDPFSPGAWYAELDTVVVAGVSDRTTLEVWDVRTRRTRTLPVPCRRRPASQAAVDAYRERRLEGYADPSDRAARRKFLDRIPYGDSLPLYGGLEITSGRLWLGAFIGPGGTPSSWLLLDGSGRGTGVQNTRVTGADRVYWTQVTEDRLVGIVWNELGEESVVVFGRRRAARPAD